MITAAKILNDGTDIEREGEIGKEEVEREKERGGEGYRGRDREMGKMGKEKEI